MRDIGAELIAQVEANRPEAPEAVSVLIDLRGFAGVNPSVVAPLVAAVEYPGRAFGEVLHVEPGEERGMFYAAVEVLGTPFSAAVIGRPMPAERI